MELIGTGTVADRIWARPAVTVLGIDCPPVVGATPSVQASARAQISLRVPPGADAAEATKLLTAHLESHAPWGARVTVGADRPGPAVPRGHHQPGVRVDGRGDAATPTRARRCSPPGMGGSIPLCNTLAALYPQAEILLIGLSEPEAQIHAVNESVSPEELERLSVAEALFLRQYAASCQGGLTVRGSTRAGPGPPSGASGRPAGRYPPTGTPASR